jgi:hypothetical protein
MRREEKIKLFKRFLKELGIYNAWMRNRKRHCELINSTKIFSPLDNNTIRDVINSSFAWVGTDCLYLWDLLWHVTSDIYFENIINFLSNKSRVDSIKKIIKKEIEKK